MPNAKNAYEQRNEDAQSTHWASENRHADEMYRDRYPTRRTYSEKRDRLGRPECLPGGYYNGCPVLPSCKVQVPDGYERDGKWIIWTATGIRMRLDSVPRMTIYEKGLLDSIEVDGVHDGPDREGRWQEIGHVNVVLALAEDSGLLSMERPGVTRSDQMIPSNALGYRKGYGASVLTVTQTLDAYRADDGGSFAVVDVGIDRYGMLLYRVDHGYRNRSGVMSCPWGTLLALAVHGRVAISDVEWD